MPALARGGLLDLHAKTGGAVNEIEGCPIAAAMFPLWFERHCDDLFNHLATDAVAQDRRGKEATRQAIDDGSGRHVPLLPQAVYLARSESDQIGLLVARVPGSDVYGLVTSARLGRSGGVVSHGQLEAEAYGGGGQA